MSSPPQPQRRRAARRSRLFAGCVAVAGHLAILIPFLLARGEAPLPVPDVEPVPVTLAEPPQPPEEPAPAAGPAKPAPAPPPPAAVRPPRVPPPPEVKPLPVKADREKAPPAPHVSEAELALAATAGSGDGEGGGSGGDGGAGTGRRCNMVRRLQAALRKDPGIRAAVTRAASDGRALVIWNGDWVQSSGEEGKGLAGVRQAIALEVAFAPDACRAEPVRGLVLLSMNDAPGAARLVLGSGVWRWADLLHAR